MQDISYCVSSCIIILNIVVGLDEYLLKLISSERIRLRTFSNNYLNQR